MASTGFRRLAVLTLARTILPMAMHAPGYLVFAWRVRTFHNEAITGIQKGIRMRNKSLLLVAFFFTQLVALALGQTAEPDRLHANVHNLSGEQLFDFKWQPQPLDKERRKFVRGESPPTLQGIAPEDLRAARTAARSRLLVGTGPGDGLGPLHNATSCAECHFRGGASGVDRNVTLITLEPRSQGLTKGYRAEKNLLRLFPGLVSETGAVRLETVVHDYSTASSEDYQQLRNKLRDYVPGGIKDEWFVPKKRTPQAIAKQPVMAGRFEEWDFYLSQRNAPPLFGLGAIDNINPERLQGIAEKQARESDGLITGRVEGKFGWRGQIASLSAFVGQACAGELGLSHELALQSGDPLSPKYVPPGFDITSAEVSKLVSFVSTLPPPEEAKGDERIYRGEEHFNEIGCATCHVADVFPAAGVFSDFLVHDMGYRLQAPSPSAVGDTKLLADERTIPRMRTVRGPISGEVPPYYSGITVNSASSSYPAPEKIEEPTQPRFPRGDRPLESNLKGDLQGKTWDDLQREWKTPALWGLADTAPYLHDGRAATIEEAIEWHGGEAHQSAGLFAALNKEDREDLIRFLKSLKAPELKRSQNTDTRKSTGGAALIKSVPSLPPQESL